MLKNKKIINLVTGWLLLASLSACKSPNANLPDTDNPDHSTEKFILTSVHNTFDDYDKNKNGSIESAELSEAPMAFKEMDKNNDSRLTFDEVQPSVERVEKMSLMVNRFYENMYKSLSETNKGGITAKSLAASDEFEPFRDSPVWENAISSLSTTVPENATDFNKDKVISQSEFQAMMNGFFSDLSNEQRTYRIAGLWSWLKEKFRKDDINKPKSTKPPVILVQGYAEPGWYFLYGIYRNLKKTGRDLFPINLFPNIGDIKEQAKIIAAKVEQIKKEQGVQKVDYVAHSMGGLIGRYYIQDLKGINNIEHYVSIATPHYGTYISWLGIGEGAKQMRPGSDFLKALNEGNPIRGNIKYTSIWTKTDEIVVPSSNSVLLGSNVMPNINFVGHMLILFAPKTYTQIREALDK